jgi:hypothetical protein
MIDSLGGPARSRTAQILVALTALGLSLLACSATSTRSSTMGSGGTSSASSASSASASSSSGTTSGTGGAHGPCDVLCATEATVTCPNTMTSGCTVACVFAETEVTWCSTLAAASTECLAKEPASSFACDANGETAPTSGVCTSELTAIQSCWDSGPPGGLPDLSQACADGCAKEASLACADPNCTADCQAGIMPGQKCNGAFAALVACSAKQAAASFTCTTATPPQAALMPGYCEFELGLLYTCSQGP